MKLIIGALQWHHVLNCFMDDEPSHYGFYKCVTDDRNNSLLIHGERFDFYEAKKACQQEGFELIEIKGTRFQ